MQRNFLRGLLICLVPCLIAGFYCAAALVRWDRDAGTLVARQGVGGFRLGIDLAGGTILVYEVNTERTRQRKELQGGDSAAPAGRSAGGAGVDMQQLAAQIKRRIDPADLRNVTVRPLGDTRVEIILPTGGSGGGRTNLTSEDIEEVKRLISQMGVLEFRILANGADDKEGITEARQIVDTRSQEELDALARQGLVPPSPTGEFTVRIGDTDARVRYIWAELGPEERVSLGLSNASEGAGGLWMTAAQHRAGAARTFAVRPLGDAGYVESDNDNATMVLYSRPVLSGDQLAKEKATRERLAREGKTGAEAEAEVNAKKYEYFILTRVSPIDSLKVGGDITLTATSSTDSRSGNPCVAFTFNGAGATQFGKITRRNKPAGNVTRHLAILLDEKVVSAPALQAEITSHGQITGRFDRKSVDRLVHILRSGALSAELRDKPVSENTIGPTLGADTIHKGTMAVGLSFAAVLVFMLIYYRFAGFVACVALLANLLLTIGFMVMVNAAFTLPGLAGIVLMLGMAVDANVLIYERLREERNKGANLATAIRNGYDHAFPTIIDTHLTSIFTAIVLYTFGNDQLKGFAISLTVGLVISLFTSLYMTRLMFDYWLHRKWLTQLKMMRLFERPMFNPMKYRWYFFTLTTILTVAGLGLFLVRGESVLNVDFRGGTVYGGKLAEGKEMALSPTGDRKGLRDLLDPASQKKRLHATEATLLNRPASGDLASLNVYEYEITYADEGGKASKATVSLTEKPAGATEDEMAKDVVARASHLPEPSVEQLFLAGEPDYGQGRSRYFTVRTTEKQRELVQVALDRLFRDDKGESLLAGARVKLVAPEQAVGPEDFDRLPDGAAAGAKVDLVFNKPTSPNYVRELLQREFRKAGANETVVDLAGVGPDVDGRYTRMRLDVSKSPQYDQLAGAAGPKRADQLKGLNDVLAGVKQTFETTPEPERLEVFDSQLASETRTKAFYAILASWLAILLYLWFRFGNWTFGLAAVLCLVHDLCFTLGAIAGCHYLADSAFGTALKLEDFKIDLPAVAALLTLVGYSVSDTIVVFDRIREVRGKNPALTEQMINDSVNQTLSRTVLAATTVFLVVLVLYVAGGEGVHLFAFVMVVGVLVGTYSSIFVAAPLLLMFGEGKHAPAPVEAPRAEDEEKIEA